MLNRKAYVRQININKSISFICVKLFKNIIENNKNKDYFDGENTLKLNKKLYLIYFNSKFIKQREHYHIGDPTNINDLYSNGGGERNLYGITHSGLGIKTPSQNIIIEPSSLFHIHFPGSPPTIHQFYSFNLYGQGTSIFSVHNNKSNDYGLKNMETYTIFTK